MAIAVLGAGSWGTALAMQLARNGHRVHLWARDPAQVADMAASRVNRRYLPDFTLPEAIEVTADFDAALADARDVLLAVPSHVFAGTVDRLAGSDAAAGGIAWACKGFEPGSGRFLHEVARERLVADAPLAVATGPSFAREVAADLPTAITVGANQESFGRHWAGLLHGGSFRAYYTADIIGAELGGAVKNVMAIACGISDGMNLGDNARAALITRGLAEMMRLGAALGADTRTLMGLAGMGDLVLTCTGGQSRNRRLGLALGQGKSRDEAITEIGQVVEGVKTAVEVMRLSERTGVEMPISEQIHGILFNDWSARASVKVLLEREQKAENG